MKCFRFMEMILFAALMIFTVCDRNDSSTDVIDVVFQSVTQTGGTSDTADSTGLELVFDVAPTTLTVENITLTGATKGILTGSGTARSLAISNVTVANGEMVYITITSPSGYSITGSPQSAVVYRKPAGYKQTCTVDSVSFTMVYVPAGMTFPTGTNDNDIATVEAAYWTGETEVTYRLWSTVYKWATTDAGDGRRADGGELYSFANPGRMGGVCDGSEETDLHPVTTVNWRDCMVWCNALTEWYNAMKDTNYECVYTWDDGSGAVIIKVSSNDTDETACDNVVASSTARGFRLLTSEEYELAARYRGADTTNVVTGTIKEVDFSTMAIKWTKGNSASGATTYYNDSSNGSGEPGKSANDAVAVYGSYYDGDEDLWKKTGVTSTAEVKSKTPNALGLYDISGNVSEMCFDKYSGIYRVTRDGCWEFNAYNLQIGSNWVFSHSSDTSYRKGFRFARSAP